MKEQWRRHEYFDNYEISDEGRICNVKTGRLLTPSLDKYGHLIVYLYRYGKAYKRRVSRLVAELYLDGDVRNSYIVFRDRDPRNVSADNLKLRPKEKRILIVETGEVHSSMTECSRATGISQATISRCVNDSFYGNRLNYHFEEVE